MLFAALVVACAGVRAAAPILAPTVLGAYVATVNMPLVAWLRNRGLPLTVSVVLVLLADTVLLSSFMGLIVAASTNFSNALPRYTTLFEAWIARTGTRLGDHDVPSLVEQLFHPSDAVRVAASLAGDLAGGVWNVTVALIIATFLLLRFGPRATGESSQRLIGKERIERALSEVNRYVAVKTATSMATGLLVGLFLWLVGAELPVFFGVLAFLLNYIPNLGSFAAAIPGVAVALLVGGWGHATLVAAGYAGINLAIGNVLEPRVMGRALGLWPVVVLLSVMFWGFLLGGIGALLSALLTALLKMALLASSDLRHLGLLLGPRPPRPAAPSHTPGDLLEETLPQTQDGA